LVVSKSNYLIGAPVGWGCYPGFEVVIPDDVRNMAVRPHNQAARTAMERTLVFHHKHHMPAHFRLDARHRYRHQERSKSWKAFKKKAYRSIIDLVARGKLKSSINAASTIRISGSITGGTLMGTLVMRAPFPTRNKSVNARVVTIQQMVRELQTVTDEEKMRLGRVFGDAYTKTLRSYIGNAKAVYGRKKPKP
jgi:hypothetical protein